MRYLTGKHALNLPCSLDTVGDWHFNALRWVDLSLGETATSVFGDYGIEQNVYIDRLGYSMPVANHIRALLDLIQQGKFSVAQGMRRKIIDNDEYDTEIFEKVLLLKDQPNWPEIFQFMGKEYGSKWYRFND